MSTINTPLKSPPPLSQHLPPRFLCLKTFINQDFCFENLQQSLLYACFPKYHQYIVLSYAKVLTAVTHFFLVQYFLNLVRAFLVYALPLCCHFWILSTFHFLISYLIPSQIRLSYLSAVNFYTVHLPFSVHLKNVNLSWKNTSKHYFQYLYTFVGNQYGIDLKIYFCRTPTEGPT